MAIVIVARFLGARWGEVLRVRAVLLQLLIGVDQLGQTLIVGIAYVAGLTRQCPSADETLSSYVGRAELRGAAWARPVAGAIDRLFVLLGEAPGHCQRNIETISATSAPIV